MTLNQQNTPVCLRWLRRLFFIICACLFVVGANNSVAQDMSIGGLLIDKESSTDEPPVFPEDWNPRVDKLPGTEGMARVLVYLCMVADSGHTQVIMRKGDKDMPMVLRKNPIKMLPAQSLGVAVRSQVFLSFIYNPGEARQEGASAIPRVLKAEPLLLDGKMAYAASAPKDGKPTVSEIIMSVSIDETGALQKVALQSPSVDGLQARLEEVMRSWTFAPARESGKPVAGTLKITASWTTRPSARQRTLSKLLSFKSTEPPSADTPCVISATSVALETALSNAFIQHFDKATAAGGRQPEVVVTVGADGSIVSTRTNMAEDISRAIESGLSAWRFSPAMNDNGPVEKEITLQVSPMRLSAKPTYEAPAIYPAELMRLRTVTSSSASSKNNFWYPMETRTVHYRYSSRKKTTPARAPVYTSNNAYRQAMQNAHGSNDGDHHGALLSGRVAMTVDLDTDGNATGVTIDDSVCPLFDFPAACAAMMSKYPAPEGAPKSSKYPHSFTFIPKEGLLPAGTLFEIKSPGRLSPMGGSRVTVRSLARLSVPIVPEKSSREGKTGKAVADVHVDERGQVTRVDIVDAKHPAMGHALRAALEACEFKPFKTNGKATPVILRREEYFYNKTQNKEAVYAEYQTGRRTVMEERTVFSLNLDLPPDVAVEPAVGLDSPIQPLVRTKALFPLSVKAESKGTAVIEFVIDEAGRVRSPKIVSASHAAFGYSAVQALSTWGFLGPEKDGRPLCVTTTVEYTFEKGSETKTSL